MSECVHWVHAWIRIAIQCDAAKISPRVPSTLSSRSVGRSWEDMILPGSEDSRNYVDPRNLGKSAWDQKFGMIECVFSLNDKMRWKWDAVYLSTPGSPEYILRVAHSTSVTPVSPYTHRRFLTIYLEAAVELVWRCTWRPRSNELRDALGARDQASLEMHLEAEIKWTERCTCRLWSSELRDALQGCDRESLEMHLEAEIE
jgi:hypothetical protein